MADIVDVFRFKNNYQVTNLFNKLTLGADQLTTFMQIIDEGYDIKQTRKDLLEYVSHTDYETYLYIRELLREGAENTIGLNDVLELKELIQEVSRKMSDTLHAQIVDLISNKANSNISNLFFTYVKDYETNKDFNIDIEQDVDGLNFAKTIYNLKNDIKQIVDNTKEDKQPEIKESFNIPEKYLEINKANIKRLEELKEEYTKKYMETDDPYYAEMLYESNVKLNTAKNYNIEKLNESVAKNKKFALWANNVGRLTFNPITEGKWEVIHYNRVIANVNNNRLVEFITQLMPTTKLLNESEKEEDKEEKLYSDALPDFVMDIQDVVDKDQKHLGIKPINEEDSEDKLDLEEDTCAGAIASVPQNIFAKPVKRVKENKKESKKIQFAKEAVNLLDEFNMSINNKTIDYSNHNGMMVIVEGEVANVNTKDEFITLLEMIERNEDITDYLYKGLTKDDLWLLKEDIDNSYSEAMSSPDTEDERKPETNNPEYKAKKDKLKQMADTSVSNISVKQEDNLGNETVSDDFEVLGVEDLDDNGQPSNAILKNKNTGETKTVDPHMIDIKA